MKKEIYILLVCLLLVSCERSTKVQLLNEKKSEKFVDDFFYMMFNDSPGKEYNMGEIRDIVILGYRGNDLVVKKTIDETIYPSEKSKLYKLDEYCEKIIVEYWGFQKHTYLNPIDFSEMEGIVYGPSKTLPKYTNKAGVNKIKITDNDARK